MTSSARASSIGGRSRPIAFAACRLMTSSNLVDCMTGRSAGLAPFKILGIDADLMIDVRDTGSIAHEAAGVDIIGRPVNRRDCVAHGHQRELDAPAIEEGVRSNEQSIHPVARER